MLYPGVMFPARGDVLYMPGTKPFYSSSEVTVDGTKVKEDSVAFDFSNRFDTRNGYPNTDMTSD